MTKETMKEQTQQKSERGLQKFREGKVLSAGKMNKTVVVQFQIMRKHPTYKKYVRSTTKCLAHDEKNECRQGDKVQVVSTRPLSKLKCWKVWQVLVRAEQ